MLREELGLIPDLPVAEVDGIIKNIILAQSLKADRRDQTFRTNQDRCAEDGVSYTLTFGGWAHGVHLINGTGDCRQSMGYHVLTVDPLLAMQKRLAKMNSCIPNQEIYPYTCSVSHSWTG